MEVQSQTEYPHISFRRNNLSNHSYVDFDDAGENRFGSNTDTVQCHTDLSTCCRSEQLSPRRYWFFPNGTRLPLDNESGDIQESPRDQVVHIRRRNLAIKGPSGIYRCFIATNATHDNNDPSVGEAVYVGLYHNGGGTCIYM